MNLRRIGMHQFLVFLAGGVGCALIDVGLMWWLLHLHVNPMLATTAGFLAGLLLNYGFHSRVTFTSALTPATFARFMAVVGINYLLTLLTVSLAVFLVHSRAIDSALLGKVVAMPLVAVNGYWLSKHWIFK